MFVLFFLGMFVLFLLSVQYSSKQILYYVGTCTCVYSFSLIFKIVCANFFYNLFKISSKLLGNYLKMLRIDVMNLNWKYFFCVLIKYLVGFKKAAWLNSVVEGINSW